jgi:hypothetical protein
MQNNIPDIAVATRTFGNSKMQEGLRVKAGTRFAVEKPSGDLKIITTARYKQLYFAGLVRPFGDGDMAAAPAVRPVEERVGEEIEARQQAEKAAKAAPGPRPSQRAAAAREAAVRRCQDPEPPAPKRLDNPAKPSAPSVPTGSQTGAPASASSLPEAPASNSSSPSSRPRGRRRA